MKFQGYTCRCGADLSSSKPSKVLMRVDKQPYAKCPAGCGRTHLLVEDEVVPEPVFTASVPKKNKKTTFGK